MSQKTSTSSRLPPWIERAREYIGVTEDPSPVKDNPQIIDFLRSTDVKTKTRMLGVDIPVPGGQRYLTEEIPWCAAFVNKSIMNLWKGAVQPLSRAAGEA
jgi:hypothetical protein